MLVISATQILCFISGAISWSALHWVHSRPQVASCPIALTCHCDSAGTLDQLDTASGAKRADPRVDWQLRTLLFAALFGGVALELCRWKLPLILGGAAVFFKEFFLGDKTSETPRYQVADRGTGLTGTADLRVIPEAGGDRARRGIIA